MVVHTSVFSCSDMVRRTRGEFITAGHYTHKQPAFYLKTFVYRGAFIGAVKIAVSVGADSIKRVLDL